MATASLAPRTPHNLNISAYRVLFILLMLVRFRSLNLMELNRLLLNNPLIGRVYNSETLTKYINTLREVGCVIPRSSSRTDYSYELQKNPLPLSVTAVEIAVAEKLRALLAAQPDETLYNDYQLFLEQLSWSVDDQWLNTQGQVSVLPLPELLKRREQLNQYRRFCQEAFALQVQYAKPGPRGEISLETLQVEPQEVQEKDSALILLGLDSGTLQPRLLNVDRIMDVKQSPSKNRRGTTAITVTFALYGRLAKSYRPYPQEKVVYQSASELHVKTKVLETSELMARLLKYGKLAQVLSPDSFREQMRRHLAGLLTVLDADNENPL